MTDDETLLTVAQMAEASGVTAHTLRYYERAGLIRPVARNAGNQRRYSAADVEWVAFLLRLRQTGMPIARMREYADLRQLGDTTIEERLHLLEAHQNTVREQIALLRTHENALDAKMRVYRRTLSAEEGREQ
jgi:DNA-binding transcriptional MerR regulator